MPHTKYSQMQGPCPKQKHQGPGTLGYTLQVPYPRYSPVSQKCIKCWCDDPLGKAKGIKSPTPGPRQQEEGLCSGSQSAETGPAATTIRAGEARCSPGQEGIGKGSLQQGSLIGWGCWGQGEFLHPCEGRWGRRGGLGGLREWGSPSGAYSCGPGGQPEWPSQTPPAPPPWSWLSTQGSQRH